MKLYDTVSQTTNYPAFIIEMSHEITGDVWTPCSQTPPGPGLDIPAPALQVFSHLTTPGQTSA